MYLARAAITTAFEQAAADSLASVAKRDHDRPPLAEGIAAWRAGGLS
jgi:hypothetical protein